VISPFAVREPVVTVPSVVEPGVTVRDPVVVLFVTDKEPPVTDRPLPAVTDPVVDREPACSKPDTDAVFAETLPDVIKDPTVAELATETVPAGTVNPFAAVTRPVDINVVVVVLFVTLRFPPVTEIPPVAV